MFQKLLTTGFLERPKQASTSLKEAACRCLEFLAQAKSHVVAMIMYTYTCIALSDFSTIAGVEYAQE